MNEANEYIRGLLAESWYDITEEYGELLRKWYGEDISMFDPEDEDLCDSIRRLTSTFRFWCCGPPFVLTPYEKLRGEYDALIELHAQLLEEYVLLLKQSEQLAWACQENRRKAISPKIKGGSKSTAERRIRKNDDSDAA
jgi:hypothetical protein